MPAEQTNIAMRLTARGVGAIAVVRLVGPATSPFLAKHFSKTPRPGATVHGEMREGEIVIDDPVVTLDLANHSAELHLHGGEYVARLVLDLAARAGFEIVDTDTLPLPLAATDGESIIEQEMLAWAPAARTESAARVLFAQRAAWANLAAAHPEFAEDASPVGTISAAAGVESRRMLADDSLANLLRLPTVAIVGVPNVGKSTLANGLFAADRSIAADLPGTTRDWVGHEADVGGLAIQLVDTPGVRDSADAIEQQAIAHAQPVIAAADAVVIVLDPMRPMATQRRLLDDHPAAIVVINKTDQPVAQEFDREDAIKTVATTGIGLDELRAAIRQRFGCDDLAVDRPRCWTHRQRDKLKAITRSR